MQAPVQEFLANIIDYAGLFPPAKLPMEEAFANYLRYRSGAMSWMLSRFICPARRLEEVQVLSRNLPEGAPPLQLSVLLSGGRTPEEWSINFRADLDAILRFREAMGEGASVDFLECRLPDSLSAGPAENLLSFLDAIAVMQKEAGLAGALPFFEMAMSAGWDQELPRFIKSIGEFGEKNPGLGSGELAPGFKIRCGGTTPDAYPSPAQVGAAIFYCRQEGVPLKATAGLHHPVRHQNPGEKVKMHGFLNVFGAGILARAHEMSLREIVEIVADEHAENFLFTERAFVWHTLRASREELSASRKSALISFGSCSFEEPCEDLRRMGIL
ncbi:MAG TPA: hypothetical protein PKV71_02920 [Calditrichia bacterium]|nr:hypothetical protein [Calditrichota bacterium]HQV30795.1 hypothetical protein [Calditrichia bacterium]